MLTERQKIPVLSPAEWESACAGSEPAQPGESLSQYAARLAPIKAAQAARWPGVDFSSHVYETHLEKCLRAGAEVPPSYLAFVDPSFLDRFGPMYPNLSSAINPKGPPDAL